MKNFLLCVLLGSVFFCGCEQNDTAISGQTGATFDTRFPIKFDKKIVNVQIAITDLERTNGLMRRDKLDENEGMIFVFSHNEKRNFWMQNVPINLALGYLTEDGKLDEIKALLAHDPRTVPSRSNQIRYVIELPENWFEKNQISPGAQLDIGAIRDAIAARGFQPKNYLENKN